MAKQVTLYLTRDSRKTCYYLWPKKPSYKRTRGYFANDGVPVCKSTIPKIMPQAKFTKRGMKKLTIKIEDIE